MPGQRRDGYTVLEMLVVIGIATLLSGIIWAAVMSARGKGKQAACASNLRQLAIAFGQYADDYRGWYPGAGSTSAGLNTHTQVRQFLGTLRPYVRDNRIWFCPADDAAGKPIRDEVFHDLTSYMTRTSAGDCEWDREHIPDSWPIVHDAAFWVGQRAWHFGGYNAAFADGSVRWKRLGE